MIKPKLLTSNPDYSSKSMEYDFLRKIGIEWIQKVSGNKWTDYNYHDPGITFLEQLCYALTDLGYRTNFPIQDILLTGDDKYDLEKYNLLIPSHKIFSSSPINLSDYRQLIIKKIPNIKNAWVQLVDDNKFGFKGIYEVLIQCNEEINDEMISQIQTEVHQLLMQNRSLSTDFHSVKILRKEPISISAKISIDSFVLGESVLAEIYHKIEMMINPGIKFYDVEEMFSKGYSSLDLYTGPSSDDGFIDFKNLKGKTNEIYVSEIKELIENIKGVVIVDEINVFKNGVKIFEDLISFGEDKYPSLEKNIEDYAFSSDRIVFSRNKNKCEIDTVILSQLYDSLTIDQKINFFNSKNSEFSDFNSRFLKEKIEEYYSIQNELPSIYGLKQNELSSSVSGKRKAQKKQLKAYLSIFEQLMANHLSQLVNLRNIFSIQKEIDQSYFTQIPNNIPEFSSVILDQNISAYSKKLNDYSESKEKIIERRNHILNHLLSRFGEEIDTQLLQKLFSTSNEDLTQNEIEKKVLNIKIDFAENIVNLGKDRIRSFNYSIPSWDQENISGLEKRLKLTFGIQNHSINSLVAPLLDHYQSESIQESSWEIDKISIIKGPKISINIKKNREYNNNEVSFYCQTENHFKSLFNYAIKSKNFRIVSSRIKKNKIFNLLFNIPDQEHPMLIYRSNSEENCLDKLNGITKKFRTLNIDSEGLYLIEHILLRPLVSTNYSTTFFFEDGTPSLKSYNSGIFEDQREFRDDIYVLGIDSQNYSVQKIENENKFQIVVFDILNIPLFISVKKFKSKAFASKEIKKIVAFFENNKKNKKDLEEVSTIEIDGGNSHEFPIDFNYSNSLSLILPDWPLRFQNNEFIEQLKVKIEQFIPAHIRYQIYLLDAEKIGLFEDTYRNWLQTKIDQNNESSDSLSLQLIQLLQSYRPLSNERQG